MLYRFYFYSQLGMLRGDHSVLPNCATCHQAQYELCERHHYRRRLPVLVRNLALFVPAAVH